MNGLEWLLENGKYVTIGKDKIFQIMIEDMEAYAKFYHENELKKNVADVIKNEVAVCSSSWHDNDRITFGRCLTCQ